MNKPLIAAVEIRVYKSNCTDAEVDVIGDILDSIDFESIVKQKLEERVILGATVEVESQ